MEIEEIVSEAFMPIGYGGGINQIDHIEKLFKIGVEKVILNSAAFENEQLISEASSVYGSQSIVVCLDYKKDLWGDYKFYTRSGSVKIKGKCEDVIKRMEDLGAGEIILNSIDKDGTMTGYDLTLFEKLAKEVAVPVIASGGAANIQDFVKAIHSGASAVAAGSMFVYHGIHRAVLISYIQNSELDATIKHNSN
jgi:cyclase